MIVTRSSSDWRSPISRIAPAVLRTLAAGLVALPIANGPCAPDAAAVGDTIRKRRAGAARRSGLLALLLTMAMGSRPARAVVYTVTDLGSLGGYATVALSLNNLGQVVGWSTTTPANNPRHPFLYDSAGMHDLSSALGAGDANAINDAGQIAVSEQNRDTPLLMFDGTLHNLGALNDDECDAKVINARGHVAGDVLHFSTMTNDVLFYDGTALHDIGALPGYPRIDPTGINAADVIVGGASVEADPETDQPGRFRAFVWQNSVMRDLGTLGGTNSYAYGINDAGQIVGASTIQASSDVSHAFLYDSSGMHDLGTLGGDASTATAINNLGQIVGYSLHSGHGFIYSGGVMRDLDPLLLPHPAWSLFRATAINDHGVILATGIINSHSDGGDPRAYLLTPSPGPILTLHSGSEASFTNPVLSFGNQPAGTTSAAQTLTLTNEGDLPAAIDGISLTGPNGTGAADPAFAIVSDSGETTLAPGASRTIWITFTPAAGDSHSAALAINHNDARPAAPHLVALTGTGIVPVVTLGASSVSFGSQRVGTTSAAQTVTITDSGPTPLILQSAAVQGANAAEFRVPDLAGLTIAPGESRTISLQFAPADRGSRSAALVITDNAPGSPHLVSLTGTGIGPVVRIDPTSLDFGPQPVGLNATVGVLVQNSGDAPLHLGKVGFQGPNAEEFSLATGGSGETLQAGDIALLNIRFSPAATGSRSASLVLASDAPDSPQIVPLTGVGTEPLLRLSADSLLFAVQPAGSSAAAQTLALTNNGDAPLAIEGLSLSGPDAASFHLVSDTGEPSLNPGQSRTLTISFSPAGTTAGLRARIATVSYKAALEIQDNDPHPDAPHTVTLFASTAPASGYPGPTGVPIHPLPPTSLAPTTPPAAPTGLTVHAPSAGEVDLAWTDHSDNEQAFAIWRTGGGQDWARVGIMGPHATRYADTTVQPGVSYTYKVRAIGGGAASDWSNTVSLTPGAPPAAPTGLAADAAGNAVTLIWSSHSTDEQAFAIWRTGGGQDWARVGIVGPRASSYTDAAVRPGTAYSYQVRAINRFGASDWSNTVSVTTAAAPPAAPTGLAASVSGGQVTLTWTNPSTDAHALAIWRQGGGQDWARVGIAGPQAASYTDSGLAPGTSYTYRLRAIGAGGASGWSNAVSVLRPATP